MASVPFDTLKAYKSLQEAGFDECQAEAVIATVGEALGGNMATKDDIRDMSTKEDIGTWLPSKISLIYEVRWLPSRILPISEEKRRPNRTFMPWKSG